MPTISVPKELNDETIAVYFEHLATTIGYPNMLHHFKSESTISNGLKIHLDVIEVSPDAPTIVLMPGTAIYALCYGEMMYKLSTHGYNIVGFDPRGHGRSEGVRGDYTIRELMEDAERAISYAIWRFNKKVSLMGSSQGGIVALYVAAEDVRLNSVICQNIADLTAEDAVKLTKHPTLFKYLKMIAGNGEPMLPNVQIPVASYLDLEHITLKYFGTAKQFIENDPFALKTLSLRSLQSLGHTQLPKPLSQITTPVMVFQGSADTIFPVDYTQKLFDKLTCKKKLTVFPGLNHALLHDDVDIVLPEILSWLKEIYPNSSAA